MGEFTAGMRYVGQGMAWVSRNRKWYGFGLIPPLITLVLYTAALIVLALRADELATFVTPFADDWDPLWRSVLRVSVLVLAIVGGALLAVLTFTAVTLLIGDPFYEALSERVEESEGGGPQGPDRPWWRELWISLCDSLYVLVRALAFAVPLFVLGFVPLVGQTVVPVLSFVVTGFFLTVELTQSALARRGLAVRERLALLRERKLLAVGFGAPLALGFLIPVVAVFLMPGAVAGATLLVRDLTGGGEPTEKESGVGRPQPAPPHAPHPPRVINGNP